MFNQIGVTSTTLLVWETINWTVIILYLLWKVVNFSLQNLVKDDHQSVSYTLILTITKDTENIE